MNIYSISRAPRQYTWRWFWDWVRRYAVWIHQWVSISVLDRTDLSAQIGMSSGQFSDRNEFFFRDEHITYQTYILYIYWINSVYIKDICLICDMFIPEKKFVSIWELARTHSNLSAQVGSIEYTDGNPLMDSDCIPSYSVSKSSSCILPWCAGYTVYIHDSILLCIEMYKLTVVYRLSLRLLTGCTVENCY